MKKTFLTFLIFSLALALTQIGMAFPEELSKFLPKGSQFADEKTNKLNESLAAVRLPLKNKEVGAPDNIDLYYYFQIPLEYEKAKNFFLKKGVSLKEIFLRAGSEVANQLKEGSHLKKAEYFYPEGYKISKGESAGWIFILSTHSFDSEKKSWVPEAHLILTKITSRKPKQ